MIAYYSFERGYLSDISDGISQAKTSLRYYLIDTEALVKCLQRVRCRTVLSF